MPGPPSPPTRLKLLRGARRGGFEPPQPPAPPPSPDFLSEYARQEWERVTPNLHLFGLITVFDRMPLAAYCEAVSQWRTALELLDRDAMLDEETRGLLLARPKGQKYAHPLVRIAAEAARDLVRFAGEFGFSPAARGRVELDVRAGPSMFAGASDDDDEPA